MRVSLTEAVRAGVGAFVGLGLVGLLLLTPGVDLNLGLYLVAPFGASAVLLFAIPNSPLAQPWSAIMGNTIAALVGVAVSRVVHDPALCIALAVGLAIVATILCRAVHPPAGAVAMTASMSPDAVEALGFWFALTPIAVGTVALVALAAIYARLTGRRYPFRQFDDPSTHDTDDQNPTERLGLTEGELTGILERYHQSFNLGVEDLARLIGAAELQATAHSGDAVTAEDIMSRNVITVRPETRLIEVANLFQHHRFASLPVVGPEGDFLGVIFQLHLISEASDHALRFHQGYLAALKRLLRRDQSKLMRAGDIMATKGPCAARTTPLSSLLLMLSDGEVDAVPVLNAGNVVGVVTRTDLIAAMARTVARSEGMNPVTSG